MLTAEALYLLLTKPDGKLVAWTRRAPAMAGALLTDLLLAERIALTDERRPRMHVRSTEPTGDPVLDAALPRLESREGKRLYRTVQWKRLDPLDAVIDSLVARGVLERGGGRPTLLDPEPERQLRARLAAVLDGSAEPDVQEATLLGIIRGLKIMRRVLKQEIAGLDRGALRRRLAQVEAASPIAAAVTLAVRSQIAAANA